MPRQSTAARLARLSRDKYGRVLGPARSSGSPYMGDANAGNIGVGAEIYLTGLGWVDISSDIYYRDGSTKVSISRGLPSASSRIQPQTCSFQLNNRGNRYSPRNALGPYFGLIGRNTPVRLWRMQNGIRRYRFAGEMPSWPTTADISGNDVFTTAQAAGMLRRLSQGTPPVQSAMYRNMINPQRVGAANIVAYWPLEDASGATQYASALPSGSALVVTNPGASPASNSTWSASQPLPVMNAGVLTGSVAPYTATGQTNLRWNMIIPAAGLGATRNIITMYGTGTVRKWVIQVDASGSVILTGYDVSNTAVLNSGAIIDAVNGKNVGGGVQLTQSGGNVVWNVSALDVATYDWATGLTELDFGGTLTGQSVGTITQVVIGDSAGLGSSAIGHVALGNLIAAFGSTGLAMGANDGEPVFSPDAATVSGGASQVGRFLRLCQEQNVAGVEQYGTVYSGDTVTMGAQAPDIFPNWLQQCADTGFNLLSEARDQVALVLRSRLSLYNQSAKLTLDVAQNQLAAQLAPQDDDYYTHNDVTVARTGGSSARAVLNDGSALSVSAPPAGVGQYATSVSVSLGSDGQLADQAGWRLHMGTVNEARFPQVTINLRHPTFQNNLDLMNAALTADIGDLIVINNPPAWAASDPIRLIILGYGETMGAFEHEIVFNCAPASPYQIFILGDPVLGRADTDGSTLAAPLTTILNPNPFFAGGSLAGWGAFNASISVAGTSGSSNPLPSGGPAGYGAVLNPNGGAVPNIAEGLFTVVGGQSYSMSALVYYPSAAQSVQVGIGWNDINGAFISNSLSTTAVAANTWTPLANTITAPNNAATGFVVVGLSGTPSAGDLLYAANVVAWQGAVSVATTGSNAIWTTSASDFPVDIAVGGERMTVTSISGSSSPQAFTVARAVNAVAKPQAAGADVRLWQPPILSL